MKNIFIRLYFFCILILLVTGCTEEELQRAREAGIDVSAYTAETVRPVEEAAGTDMQAEEGALLGPAAGEGMAEEDSAGLDAQDALSLIVDNIDTETEEATGLDAIKDTENGGSPEETPMLDAALDKQREDEAGADGEAVSHEAEADGGTEALGDAEASGEGNEADLQQTEDGDMEDTKEQTGEDEAGQQSAETIPVATAPSTGNRVVVIDPGHQRKANLEKEPIGPGASQTKYKVSGGTSGKTSHKAEYELTLEVSLKLQKILEQRGYSVIMVRTSHDVNISNSERAAVANNANAAAFIRIHANGSDNTSASGAMTMCQSASNPYNGALASKSYSLSEKVLNGMVARCGCKSLGVSRTDSMSGINWCTVPVTIVEMGFMTNPQEDMLMASEDYQQKMAEGMADGIDAYIAGQ